MNDVPEVDIGRLCRGDKLAWDAFVDRYSPLIYAAVQRTVQTHSGPSNEEDIREVV